MHRLDRDFLGPLIEQLVDARHRLNLSQLELNARIGCSEGHLAKWEAGMHRPSLYFLLLWIEQLGLRIVLDPQSR